MSEKTEQPTDKKLRDARKEGQVPKSRELATAAALLAVAGVFVATGPTMVDSLSAAMVFFVSLASTPSLIKPELLVIALNRLADVIAPVLLVAMFAGSLATFLQVGPLAVPIKARWQKLNVFVGIKNLFTRRQLVEFIKTLFKMGIIFYVAQSVLQEGLRGLVGLVGRDAKTLLDGTGAMAGRLVFRVAGAVLAIAVLDVFYQRWQHRRDNRMSKEDIKREFKNAEGDPHAKQERDRVRREFLENSTAQSVRDADVLVVNPTHLAVALSYDVEGESAPLVVAKGEDHLAQRMRKIAEEAGVPIMRDVPLARSLYDLERGEEIPESLYDAVAAVLRAAWREREEAEGGQTNAAVEGEAP